MKLREVTEQIKVLLKELHNIGGNLDEVNATMRLGKILYLMITAEHV